MTDESVIGICPFGCNHDTNDKQVEFGIDEKSTYLNGRRREVEFLATCYCCDVTFSRAFCIEDDDDLEGYKHERTMLLEKLKITGWLKIDQDFYFG